MKTSKLDFLRIGSRSSTFRKLQIDDKARLLNEVIKGGLPVPASILLLDQAWDRLITDGIVEVNDADVVVNSADEFMARLALNGVRKAVAVRSVFKSTPSCAKLNVQPEPIPLIEAVVAVWQAGRGFDTRRDVLIMEMVEAKNLGTVLSRADEPFDTVSAEQNQLIDLPKLTRWQRPTQPAGWQRRLQLLLRGIRRTLSLETTQDWEITWADDGKTCWVLQIRPISS